MQLQRFKGGSETNLEIYIPNRPKKRFKRSWRAYYIKHDIRNDTYLFTLKTSKDQVLFMSVICDKNVWWSLTASF